MTITQLVDEITDIAIKEAKIPENFAGRPFYLDYDKAYLLVADAWKYRVKGIPQGTFLLAFYENEQDHIEEALLLRALKPTKLPTDNDNISSMIECYKDNLKTSGTKSQLDQFTRYELGFSGLECRILGTFYTNKSGKTIFGADVENFYSAHNYSVYKPQKKVLEKIINLGLIDQKATKIGDLRYSSSRRFQEEENTTKIPVFVSPSDFLGKRTALFGMTRTGKSNTVKEIINATVNMVNTNKDYHTILNSDPQDNLLSFHKDGSPKLPVGQIIFDINGEYANANLQDEGTAIFELFPSNVLRYSTIDKLGFKVMKVNFYHEVQAGFELVKSRLSNEDGDYVKSFQAIDLTPPSDPNDFSAKTRYQRKVAIYQCCLHKAQFKYTRGFKIKFQGQSDLNSDIQNIYGQMDDPTSGLTPEQATNWFTWIWDNYSTHQFFSNYRSQKGREWADEDTKALLTFLTRHKEGKNSPNLSGYTKIRDIKDQHTDTVEKLFDIEIIEALRAGKIVIIDLSQGDPFIQELFSERICRKIFEDNMSNFIKNQPNNFIQFYFEEAHNLFPKKDDKDLKQIYNRIAKEGAKLHMGLIYATQEVSSISSNILKNTQNWFIAHLNNEDEIRELRKYYDFSDFADSLIKFSSDTDRGFVRMKTYSNPFIIPVQINKFSAKQGE